MKTILLKIFVLFFVVFLIGLYSFCLKSFHLLSMLLSLEFMSLMLFFLFIIVYWFSIEKYILMYYLTFCVCEGVLGLSMLVMMVRSVGNDYLQSLMFLKC